MRVRPFVLCVALFCVAWGAVGCSSGTSGPGASSNGKAPVGKAPVGKPGGTVTVTSGGKVVCVITLDKNGTGTCKVSTVNQAPGKYTFTGTYKSSGGFKSGSGSTTLTVLPAKQAT